MGNSDSKEQASRPVVEEEDGGMHLFELHAPTLGVTGGALFIIIILVAACALGIWCCCCRRPGTYGVPGGLGTGLHLYPAPGRPGTGLLPLVNPESFAMHTLQLTHQPVTGPVLPPALCSLPSFSTTPRDGASPNRGDHQAAGSATRHNRRERSDRERFEEIDSEDDNQDGVADNTRRLCHHH
jgi:hypothetical protein